MNVFIHLALLLLKSVIPKMHKLTDSDSFPKHRTVVSSVGTYNYNLAKYLCNFTAPF